MVDIVDKAITALIDTVWSQHIAVSILRKVSVTKFLPELHIRIQSQRNKIRAH
jgi:intein-encoded DNA endonuclease-like protein